MAKRKQRLTMDQFLRKPDTLGARVKRSGKVQLAKEPLPEIDAVYVEVAGAKDGAVAVPYVKHETDAAALKRAGIPYKLEGTSPRPEDINAGITAGVERQFARTPDGLPEVIGCTLREGPGWPYANIRLPRGTYMPTEIIETFWSEDVVTAFQRALKRFADAWIEDQADDA
jgi:hypothetical protein